MAKAVAKTEQTGIATEMPEFMKGADGRGTEGLSANALSPPRLKMAQALSPELEEIEGLRAGQFFNSSTGKVYGPVVRIVPVWLSEAYYLFAPRVEGSSGGLLARADDGKHWDPPNAVFDVTVDKKGNKAAWKTAPLVSQSGLAAWGTSDPSDSKSKPAAVHAINVICLALDHMDDGPSVASFQRSGLSVTKNWAGRMKFTKGPSYGKIFELSSLKVEGPSGPYYEPRFKAAGFVADKALYLEAEAIYEMASAKGVRVDVEPEGESRAAAEETAAY